MKKGKNLDAFRDREDFKKLLAGVTDARKVANHNGPHLQGRVTRSHPLRGKVGQLAAVARVQLTSWPSPSLRRRWLCPIPKSLGS